MKIPPLTRGLKVAVLLVATMPFWDLGHPLWEVDDARYAEIPREMVERRDWASPTLDYMDYVEKPPLPYWLGAASYEVFGVSEAASRVPIALLALMTLAGVVWLGSWLFSPLTGLYGALILGSTLQFTVLTHMITPDLAVTAFLFWASALLLRAILRPGDSRWAEPAAGAAMGLAFLSKGLIALAFPVAWLAALAFLRPALRRRIIGLARGWTLPACLAVAAPWLFVMEKRHPGFFHFFFVEQQFQRYLTPKYNRPGPWHYFFGVELAGLMPWTPLVLAALWKAWRERSREGEGLLAMLLWTGLVFVFFTVSSSKLPTYILPLFPQQCLLAGALAAALEQEAAVARRLRRAGLALGALLGAAAVLGAAWAASQPLPEGVTTGLAVAAVAAIAAMAAACSTLGASDPVHQARRTVWRTAVASCACGAALLAGGRLALPRLSAKEVSAEISARARPGDRVMTYGTYLHGIPFYTGLPVDVVNWVGELHYAKRDPRFAGRFGDDNTIRGLAGGGPTTFVVLRRREVSYFVSLNRGALKGLQPFGPWVLATF